MATNCLPWRSQRQRVLWLQLLIACSIASIITWRFTPTPIAPTCPQQTTTSKPTIRPPTAITQRHWQAAIHHIINHWPAAWALQNLQINDHRIHLHCASQHTTLHHAWATLRPLIDHGKIENMHHDAHGYQADILYATTMPPL